MRLLVALMTTVALLAAACGAESERSAPPETSTDTREEVRRAPDIDGVTLDGTRISLADFHGRPVFVNVWSSW